MYKLRNGVELPKEFKIKVNPEQSEALQLHLFSIGVSWLSNEQRIINLEYQYLYLGSYVSSKITYGECESYFNNNIRQKIKFKDYFDKVTNRFPEKWCVEVTQDNCNELNVYLHRNWKNYVDYKDSYYVQYEFDAKRYFYSDSNFYSDPYGHSTFEHINSYTIITTEQFRKQFGILSENHTFKDGSKIKISEILEVSENWQDKAIHYKQRCKDLRLERYEMSNEIEQLKKELELYNSIKDLSIAMKKYLQ